MWSGWNSSPGRPWAMSVTPPLPRNTSYAPQEMPPAPARPHGWGKARSATEDRSSPGLLLQTELRAQGGTAAPQQGAMGRDGPSASLALSPQAGSGTPARTRNLNTGGANTSSCLLCQQHPLHLLPEAGKRPLTACPICSGHLPRSEHRSEGGGLEACPTQPCSLCCSCEGHS